MDTDEARQLIDRIRRDSGGAFLCGLAYIGDRLGLFAALADSGRIDASGLAATTGLHERYVLEWLRALAAFGYVEHQPDADTYSMTAAQRAVLVDEGSPWFGAGTFQFTLPSLLPVERLIEAFREGGGIRYEELHPDVPESIDRMHRPWFDHLLTGQWLPAVEGLEQRLQSGVDVLDVGCGLGRSTVALGRAYPASRVIGVDPHAASIERAHALAAEAGLGNVSFVASTLADLAAQSARPRFDLVVAIDCIHDMRDPVGALVAARECLREGGLVLWSEPTGSTNPLDNQAELPRLRAALSSFHCLTVSLAEGGPGLGTLIGVERAEAMAAEAGFGSFEILPVPSDTQQFFGLRERTAGT